jgi:hypothetical protein
MPYLKSIDRFEIEQDLDTIGFSDFVPNNGAHLNFIVCTLVNNYIEKNGLDYAGLQEMIGSLDCAKMEIYRRIAGPYEDKKIKENGDVFSLKSTT